MAAQIGKIGVVRRDGRRNLHLLFEGRRISWEVGFVGSFTFARCEDEKLTVKEAVACIRAIHQWMVESLMISSAANIPTPTWLEIDGKGATVVNWLRM